jgi:hypothetical protein
MANLDFISDLKLGNEGEESIIKYLLGKGCEYIDSNNNNKYDLKMITKGVETTYEIKTDVKCAPLFDTGNIFIEYESRGKASGIVVTEADWFVTYFQYLNEAWFIKSDKLKQLINENDFPTFKDAGDIGSATHGYLIKRKNFKEHFYVCKI